MDSYDLFGEDGGGMLDGLADLGSDNFDPTRGEGQQPAQQQPPQQQAAQQQQQYYPPPQTDMHQESPLQKLASFGGDFTSNHLESGGGGGSMYGGYGGSGEAPRPAPTTPHHQAYSQQQRHMQQRTAQQQYYPDSMYTIDQQQGWGDYSMSRHYQQQSTPYQAPSSGRQSATASMYPGDKMQYQQQQYQQQQQYSQQRAAAAQQQHYQQMFGAGYPGYIPHQQQTQPTQQSQQPQQQQQSRVQHHMQQQQYQPQMDYQQHYQQQQPSSAQQQTPSQRGPIGVEVASPQYRQSSPQYRPPFPQLSPQMSPRQMSPRPQLSSPRPVVSPAKPQSPRHKPSSGGYPPQTTLQQLEQMVMPGQEYQGYRNQWPPRPQHNGPPQDHSSYIDPETGKQSDLRVPTPHGDQPPQHPDYPHREKFSSPSHPNMGDTPPAKPLDTGQSMAYSDPFQNGNKMDDIMNHSEKAGGGLGDLQVLGEASATPPSQYGSGGYGSQDVQQMMQQQSSGFPENQGPPPQQPVYQSPISHQQEMAALQQQLQEAYCMPQSPDIQVRIQHLQERITLLQNHETNDHCLGGQHCLLQSPAWSSPAETVPPPATRGRGRGRGRGTGAGPGRPRKPRKKPGESLMETTMMGNIPPGMGPPPGMGIPPMGPSHLNPMMSNMMGTGYINSQPMVPQPPPPPQMMMTQQQMSSDIPPQMEMLQPPQPQMMQSQIGMHQMVGDIIPPPSQQMEPQSASLVPPPLMHHSVVPGAPEPAPPPPSVSSAPPAQMEPSVPEELNESIPSVPCSSIPVSGSPPPDLALAPQESPSPQTQEEPPSLDAEEEEEEEEEAAPPLIDTEPSMPLLVAEAPVATPPPSMSNTNMTVPSAGTSSPQSSSPVSVQPLDQVDSPHSPIVPAVTPREETPPPRSPSPPPLLEEVPTEDATPIESPPPSTSDPTPHSEAEDEHTQTSSTNVFNFTDDEETPPPPLHGEAEKKKRKSREPKKPKEPKAPKAPKPPKEPKVPKTPKTPKVPKERKKKEPKLSSESSEEVTPKKRGPKKKKKEKEVKEEVELPKERSEDELTTVAAQEEEEPPKITEEIAEDDKEIEESRGTESIEEEVTPKKTKKARDRSSKSKSKKSSKSSNRKSKKVKANTSDGEGPSSPLDDDTNKRRSARNTQRKKYVDDIMLSISDEENSKLSSPKADSKASPESSTPADPAVKPNFVYVNPTDEDSMVVQIILATRKGTREVKIEEEVAESEGKEKEETVDEDQEKEKPDIKPETDKDDQPSEISLKEEDKESLDPEAVSSGAAPLNPETKVVEVEEYYVKYRNFSYLHCEWKTEEELYKGDKRMAAKIKRFRQKQAHQTNIFENLEEDPFNPDYVEVERVLDVSELPDPNTGKTIKHYLVKWRALQYEDSTWELQDDVDPAKIEQFNRFSKLPPKDQLKVKKKPTAKEWEKLEKSPLYKNDNTLRDYQLEGLNWLLFSWYNGRNCILADEMGLGKTIQSLTFIHAVHEYGIRGPFLVIAPLSTIPNWQREFEAWTDLNVVVYHGSAASRNMLQEYELYFRNEKGTIMKDVPKINVLITTFEIIITDINDLRDFTWRICVIDEAHRLKNRNCKLLEGLRLLNLEHRVLLSGTPLQNNVNELFSLLNFLEPQQFNSCDAFMNEFGGLKSETEVQKLQLLLKPMMLRRLKEDVEKTLAPKEETVVEVELTNIQKKYYRGILERNFSFLSKGTTSANVPNLMNTMMELRKCCIHPYLLNGAEDQIQHDYKQAHGEDPDVYYKALIQSSGKMVLIDKLLPKLKDNGHRVLIFSQMVRCLDILEDYLVFRKYPFERIDGRIRGNLRQAAIDRFCKPDSDRFVFLLCTKAGGLGINLTAADTVIIYDSDWNPQNDLQAQARCHRIGQQKMVKVYRLLCRNTYEREMFDKASLKLGLDKAILQSMNTSQSGKDPNANKQLTKKEIEDLLKKGAYGAIMDEDNAADKFCEEDIDQILERRTQVITLESEKGSTFSKASFTSSGIRHDIDIDDPDFWKKWAKKADIDTSERDEQSDLLLHEPRRRTQIKRYGHDDNVMDISDLESSSGGGDSDNENDLSSRGRRVKNKLKRTKFRLEEYQTGGGKEGDSNYGTWARSECFKVERGLLTFGWGRWQEILAQNQFREGWRESDIEECARVIILYCLRFYRGDDKIRTFIWELITPPENGQTDPMSRNHAGIIFASNIPRGRKAVSRRAKARAMDVTGGLSGVNAASMQDDYSDHWSRQERYDGDIFLEPNYRKHLSRHANKLLLRVRMLHYIKHEIIGDLVQNITEGTHVSSLGLASPHCDQSTSPAPWWDRNADKSLIVGTYKHGYEGYNKMRADPSLSFLAMCGPPVEDNDDVRLSDEDDESEKASSSSLTSAGAVASTTSGDQLMDPSKPQWPSMGDLNHRLRRVINSYQRNFKKEELKLAQKAKAVLTVGLSGAASSLSADQTTPGGLHHPPTPADITALMASQGWDWHQLAIYLWKLERREKYEQMARERERQKLEVNQRKWSKREEQDFFRTVSSYGVNYNRQKKKYEWGKFRVLARLEKKFDDTMTEYFLAFSAMCKRVCGIKPSPEEELVDLPVEVISEERARRVLDRISLLSKIREEILMNPLLDEKLALCKPSADTPDWWIPGKHDKDLLVGVAKHGLGRTDFYILNDPELSFYAVTQKNVIKPITSIPISGSINNSLNPVSSVTDQPSTSVKVERAEDLIGSKNEILVKLEKGEGTLKIEKIAVKSEDDKVKDEIVELQESDKEKSQDIENTELTESNIKTEAEGKDITEPEIVGPIEIDDDDEKEESVNTQADKEEDKELKAEIKASPSPNSVEASTDSKANAQESTKTDNNNLGETEVAATSTDGPSQDETAKQSQPEQRTEDVSASDLKEASNLSTEKDDVSSCQEKTTKEDVKEMKTEETSDTVKASSQPVQVDGIEKFKALFPELEVMQKLPEIDTSVVTETTVSRPTSTNSTSTATITATPVATKSTIDTTVAQIIAHSYQNHIKWPKEHALQVRLEHIVHAVERGEWPVGVNFSAYSETGTSTEPAGVGQLSHHLQALAAAAASGSNDHRSSPSAAEIITITTDHHGLVGGPAGARHHVSNPSIVGVSSSSSVTAAHQAAALAAKRKRHIAIDVETERAKLHALLNSTASLHQHQVKSPWADAHHSNDESLSEDSRRSTPGLQPPPAHQQHSTAARVLSLPFDLSLGKVAAAATSAAAVPTPPASSGSGAIAVNPSGGGVLDLSAPRGPAPPAHSTPVVCAPPPALTELPAPQDFSIKKQSLSSPVPAHQNQPSTCTASSSTSSASLTATKSKLDDTLSKLMLRKNCPVEEPVVGKEKKRRKLDEIVLGLSAAKEQMKTNSSSASTSMDKTASRDVSPSVTVTVSQGKPTGSRSSATSSPSPKDAPTPLSSYLEQHNHLLRQQQTLHQQILQQQQALSKQSSSLHHRSAPAPSSSQVGQPPSSSSKTYDQMIADITKMSSFSNDAKVNKWLAEQSVGAGLGGASLLGGEPAGLSTADFLARRRRPRVDPTLLDWKKLTGEENVSVINKLTGKKLTGSKAPQLKRLAQWLLENPMYDVDPKWAELVKEKGNLPSDLAKRTSSSSMGAASSAAAAAAMAAVLQQPSASAAASSKKQGSRPPLMSSPPNASTSAAGQQSNLQFPSLAGINPALLSLGGFDPKNNPLLFPFGGMSGALGGLSNMNLTNSLFANLAGLGLPNLGGMDSSQEQPSTSKQTKPSASRSKPDQSKSASNMQNQLPFFFPNPSLLYSPLGLGGLNPFTLQAGGAYDSLGLLNGGLGNAQLPRSSKGQPSSSSRGSSSSAVLSQATTSAASQSSRSRQQFTLPQDTQLLETLSRAASKSKPQPSKSDVDSLRSLMAAAAGSLKDKETLEALSRTSADLLFSRLPQTPAAEQPLKKHTVQEDLSLKRKRDMPIEDPTLSLTKKLRPELTVERRDEEPSPVAMPIPACPVGPEQPPSIQDSSANIGAAVIDNKREELAPSLPASTTIAPVIPPDQPSQKPPVVDVDNLNSFTNAKEVVPVNKASPPHSSTLAIPPQQSPPPEVVNVSGCTESSSDNAVVIGETATTPQIPKEPPAPPKEESSPPPPPPPPPDVATPVEELAPELPTATSTSPRRPSTSKEQTPPTSTDEPPPSSAKHSKKSGKGKRKASGPPLTPDSITEIIEKKNLRSSAGRAAAAAAARQRAASLESSEPST